MVPKALLSNNIRFVWSSSIDFPLKHKDGTQGMQSQPNRIDNITSIDLSDI